MSQKLLLINPYKSSKYKFGSQNCTLLQDNQKCSNLKPATDLPQNYAIQKKNCATFAVFFLPLRKQALSLVSCRAVWFLIFYLKGKDFSPLSVCPHTANFKTILHLGQLPEFIPLNGQLSWYNLYASYPCLIAFLCQVPKKPASPTV